MANGLRRKGELDRAIRTMERAVGMCTKAAPRAGRGPPLGGGWRDQGLCQLELNSLNGNMINGSMLYAHLSLPLGFFLNVDK